MRIKPISLPGVKPSFLIDLDLEEAEAIVTAIKQAIESGEPLAAMETDEQSYLFKICDLD